ncbi:MAG: hypothetical protein CMM77_13055 [Rhodospirillaceae bacterium]|nr:hypothetical protein [Magnetovibrio sp.]MAY68040.1 hypothetical protein [Rhodospirillaceae bacterium]
MLVPYEYVPHQMERMQEFINFIFDVWCSAPSGAPYSLNLYNGNPDLKEIMTAFHYADTQIADFYSSNIEAIYRHFSQLDQGQIDQLRLWFDANNQIEAACSDKDLQIARYAEVEALDANLAAALRKFFTGIYDKVGAADLVQKIGTISAHHDAFVLVNNFGKCPFCGLSDLKGEYHEKREAYDHYLPKALYPFNSINFRNLVPTCHECNSVYKLQKDPAFGEGARRKSFFAYSAVPSDIRIKVKLASPNYESISPDDIVFEYGPPEKTEEIATWCDLYGIDERYKAKCCGENDGKYWVAQVLDECANEGVTPDQLMARIRRQAEKSPLAESNFLKKAFLEGCKEAGFF